jgi:hypothetical protein
VKSDSNKEILGTAIIEVEKYSPKYLPLHMSIAHGETPSGEKYEVSLCTANGSYLLTFPGNAQERYLISMKEVVFKALDLRERRKACQATSYPEPGEDGAIPGFDSPSVEGEKP